MEFTRIDYEKDPRITKELENFLFNKLKELLAGKANNDHVDFFKLVTSTSYSDGWENIKKDITDIVEVG